MRQARQWGISEIRDIDKATVANEARCDGIFLLRNSDESMTATDVAVAYKQLFQVERGWHDLKAATAIRLRPVFHYREDRIRAHVQRAGWRCCSCALPSSEPMTRGTTCGPRSTGCTS